MGLHLTEKKCQFGKEQIEFFGHVFTKDGLKPSPDKVRAIKECATPENKEAVRSFLGMAGYLVDSFIKNNAALAALLYYLTRKETKFHWGKEEEEAFRRIQESISSEKTMAFSDPSKPITLRTEASFMESCQSVVKFFSTAAQNITLYPLLSALRQPNSGPGLCTFFIVLFYFVLLTYLFVFSPSHSRNLSAISFRSFRLPWKL